jgi:hypothetical protein
MARDVRLIRSPLSVAGMVLTTISAVVFTVVLLADLFGLHTNPYIGILFFLVLPALFLFGLLLMPLGVWVERRRRAAGKAPSAIHWPRVDLNDPTQRLTAVIVFLLTMANVTIVSLAAYRGVEYMKPEFVAHEDQPHARVACVECHVGPGATSFAKAKLAGTRRVLAVTLGNYPRPIKARADQLLPAHDTCERCHWSEQFHGDKVRRIVEYANDDKNTESVTTLRVHVGGGDARSGTASGIHWHMNLTNQIEYIASDGDRQVIPYVRITDAAGQVREYLGDGATPELLATGERHQMDCTDCHNRPSHAIAATPERAVNDAMARGDIPTSLPFLHREAVKALQGRYASQQVGVTEISRQLRDFYRAQPSPAAATVDRDLERAVTAVQTLLRRNVFPEMEVGFGTYPNNIGHVDSPGCFRCHDDTHVAKDGKKIGQDCETCHAIE